MQLISWNINGIRSAIRQGFWEWFEKCKADVICFQETKINQEQLIKEFLQNSKIEFENLGSDSTSSQSLFSETPAKKTSKKYYYILEDAKKPGYSGVMTICKNKPQKILTKTGIDKFDNEGRTIITFFEDFILFNCYYPNGQRDLNRIPFKLEYSDQILKMAQKFRKKQKNIILTGDFNVAHTEIDIKNAKSNKNNSGFTQIERDWFSKLLSKDYIDTFRHCNPNKTDSYTWWSNRPGVRERNVGWRIDYFVVTNEMQDQIKSAKIHPDVYGSDHCPISLNF